MPSPTGRMELPLRGHGELGPGVTAPVACRTCHTSGAALSLPGVPAALLAEPLSSFPVWAQGQCGGEFRGPRRRGWQQLRSVRRSSWAYTRDGGGRTPRWQQSTAPSTRPASPRHGRAQRRGRRSTPVPSFCRPPPRRPEGLRSAALPGDASPLTSLAGFQAEGSSRDTCELTCALVDAHSVRLSRPRARPPLAPLPETRPPRSRDEASRSFPAGRLMAESILAPQGP